MKRSPAARPAAMISAALRVTLLLTLLALFGSGAACAPVRGAPAVGSAGLTHQQNPLVPDGAAWTQHYFASSDESDTELHADVLLPEGLAEGEQVPVIMSVGPYFGHSGASTLEGRERSGPSDRFNDLVEGTRLFERGYALVTVDLRGFGGSSGCLDVGGAGDRADVRAALDWVSTQPWSTGSVGMYGKSFDAITGLIGNNLKHDALKAVIAQEPIWDMYRNTRSNGVPRTTVVTVPSQYELIATLPQLPDDQQRYRDNANYEQAHPECGLANRLSYQSADRESAFWADRNYAAQARGTDTPLFVTQGLLEWNTEPEAMQEFLANHQGPQRGWVGPWDHKRGNDRTADGRLEMGREGWFAETMSFYDHYLKGIEPPVENPNFAVQDNTGNWRAQDSWPATNRSVTVPVGGGSYRDDGAELGTTGENAFLRWSEPLTRTTRVTGTPRVKLRAEGHGNVMVKLYDVAPDGTAVMFDEQVSTLKPGATAFDLKSTDWSLPAGHRLAVEVGTTSASALSDWIDTPSQETITVQRAGLELELDDPSDDKRTAGARAPYLDAYQQLFTKPLPVGPADFTLPAGH